MGDTKIKIELLKKYLESGIFGYVVYLYENDKLKWKILYESVSLFTQDKWIAKIIIYIINKNVCNKGRKIIILIRNK